MHITITGVHIEITSAIHDYAMEKMNSLNKFVRDDDTSAMMEVILTKTTEHHSHGDVFQAEARFRSSGKSLTAKTTEDDLYKAIDTLKDRLMRELSQHKDKRQSIFKRGAHKIKSLLKGGN